MEEQPLPFTQRLSARHWVGLDVVLAAIFAAGSAGAVVIGRHGAPSGSGFVAVRYLVVAAACGALPLRRRHPKVVLAVSMISVALLASLGMHGPVLLVVALVVYSLAVASAERLSLVVVGAVVAALVVGALGAAGGPDWGDALSGPAVALIGWLAGEHTRTRRAYVRGVADRAAEREREREERSRRAAADERIRIARELHDVVAHAMSVITVRSGVARLVLDERPEGARDALAIIEDTGKAVAGRTAAIGRRAAPLRTRHPRVETAPAPGLADLPQPGAGCHRRPAPRDAVGGA